MKQPVRIAVTGPAGQIGYSILFRLASGAMLGPDQPVSLTLLERPNPTSSAALKGVMMELDDCAFPTLAEMKAVRDPAEAFDGAEYVFLIGARPRGPGIALNEAASRNVKVLVVGNPCNTNARIAMLNAPDLPRTAFSALLRLDQNRALSQLAQKTGSHVTDIRHLCVWGNHAPTMVSDITHATVSGRPALELVDDAWVKNDFMPTVAKRGSAIIQARGASSAASAASAAIDHMRDWALGSNGEWVTMGVPSDGSYGVPEGLVFGFPCITKDGGYEIVKDLPLTDDIRAGIAKNVADLEAEAAAVKAFVPA